MQPCGILPRRGVPSPHPHPAERAATRCPQPFHGSYSVSLLRLHSKTRWACTRAESVTMWRLSRSVLKHPHRTSHNIGCIVHGSLPFWPLPMKYNRGSILCKIRSPLPHPAPAARKRKTSAASLLLRPDSESGLGIAAADRYKGHRYVSSRSPTRSDRDQSGPTRPANQQSAEFTAGRKRAFKTPRLNSSRSRPPAPNWSTTHHRSNENPSKSIQTKAFPHICPHVPPSPSKTHAQNLDGFGHHPFKIRRRQG